MTDNMGPAALMVHSRNGMSGYSDSAVCKHLMLWSFLLLGATSFDVIACYISAASNKKKSFEIVSRFLVIFGQHLIFHLYGVSASKQCHSCLQFPSLDL